MALTIPEFTVTFDDGRVIEVAPKPRDLARLEQEGFSLDDLFSMVGFYTLSLTTLRRLAAAGEIDGVVPESVDAFIACADVLPVADEEDEEDPEGKGSGPVPSTG